MNLATYLYTEIVSIFTVKPPSLEEEVNLTPEQKACYKKIVKTFLDSSECGQTYIITFRAINRTGLEESIVACQETIGNTLRQIPDKHKELQKRIQSKQAELQRQIQSKQAENDAKNDDARFKAFATCQKVIRYIDDNWSKLTNLKSLTTAYKKWEELENEVLEFDPEKSGTLTDWKEYWRNNSLFVKAQLQQMIETHKTLESEITVTITKVEPGSSQFDQEVDSIRNKKADLDNKTDNRIKGTFQILVEEDTEHSQQVSDGSKSPPRKKFAIQKPQLTYPYAVSSVKSEDESTEELLSGLKPKKPSKQASLSRFGVVHNYPWDSQSDSDSHKQDKLDKVLETIVRKALSKLTRKFAGDPNKTREPYNAVRHDFYKY